MSIISLSHSWESNPFWHMDAQNPLAKNILRCRECGAIKVIGYPMPVPCIPKFESDNSGFKDQRHELSAIVARGVFHLEASSTEAR